jgi:hypothetical protein
MAAGLFLEDVSVCFCAVVVMGIAAALVSALRVSFEALDLTDESSNDEDINAHGTERSESPLSSMRNRLRAETAEGRSGGGRRSPPSTCARDGADRSTN